MMTIPSTDMRLATVADRMVIVDGEQTVDVASLSGGRFGPNPMAVLEHWDDFLRWAERTDYRDDGGGMPDTLSPRRFGAPVPRPRQVFASALNYPLHADEVGLPRPAQPLIFTKYPAV